MAGTCPFACLIRFENELGEARYGELPAESLTSLVGSTVKVYKGDFPWGLDFQESGETDIVHKVGDAQPSIFHNLITNTSRS